MIVTPKVKEYIAKYFGCYDPGVGALLEDYGDNSSRNNHWERLVFADDIMLEGNG